MLIKLMKNKRHEKLKTRLDAYKNNKDNFIEYNIVTLKNYKEIGIINLSILINNEEKHSFYRLNIIDYKKQIGYLNYQIKKFKDSKEIFIDDIKVDDQNKGIGTKIIKYLEQIAINNEVRIIRGELSPIDLNDHGEMLINFYKKLGFSIEENRITKHVTL